MGKRKKSTKSPQQNERRYAGAVINRLNSDWIAASTSADSEIWASLRVLRDRSRSLCRDNDYAIGAVRTILSNVLGENGIRMQSKVKLQRGDRLNDPLNKNIEGLWKRWQNPCYCDVRGILAWPQLERIALRSVVESGEVLVRKIPKQFEDSPVPFALQVIESDQLADDYSLNLKPVDGNVVKMGVELDKWERPVAYWIYPYHPGDQLLYSHDRNRSQPIRVLANEIIHLYVCDRPGQTRGVPWFSAAINRLRHMGGYEEAEIIKARAHACAMGFIQSPEANSFGEDKGDGGKKQLGFEAGTIHALEPGETFNGFAPTSPNQGLDPFLRFMLRGVAAGIGVPSDALSMDYSQTTYGGQRAAMLDARDYWGVIQQWLSSSLHQKVFEEWLNQAVYSNALSLPGFEADKRWYNHPAWMPRGWSWIDPSKDVNASIAAITNGLSTLGRELASQGLDFEEIVEDRRREVDLLKKAKISVEIYPETMPEPPTPKVDGAAGETPSAAPKDGLQAVRSIADGLTPVRPWEGLRAAKKCKAKPCGNTCIATSKACLQGLTPAQKKLAQAAGKAMAAGKVGDAKTTPTQKTKKPAAKAPKEKDAKAPAASKTEKEQLDPILHDFYDHVKNGGKLTPNETMLAEKELGVESLQSWKQSKIAKLQGSKLSSLEAAAVENYIGSGYEDMNAALYGSTSYQQYHGVEAWKAQMAINKAAANGMAKIPNTTEEDLVAIGYKKGDSMIRSETWNDEGALKAYIAKHEAAIKSGEPLLKEQFLSTTFDQNGLDYFSEGANVTIVVKAKTDGTGNSILVDKYKNQKFEAEVLYRPMTSFKVTKVELVEKATKEKTGTELLVKHTNEYYKLYKVSNDLMSSASFAGHAGTSVTGQMVDYDKNLLKQYLPEGVLLSSVNTKKGIQKVHGHLNSLLQKEALKGKEYEASYTIPAQLAKYKIYYEEI